jgi:hypothetical protein
MMFLSSLLLVLSVLVLSSLFVVARLSSARFENSRQKYLATFQGTRKLFFAPKKNHTAKTQHHATRNTQQSSFGVDRLTVCVICLSHHLIGFHTATVTATATATKLT